MLKMPAYTDLEGRAGSTLKSCKNLLLLSATVAFVVGLTIGILIAVIYFKTPSAAPSAAAVRSVFVNNSYKNNYPTVSFVENPPEAAADAVVTGGIFWGDKIERALPEGYRKNKHQLWENYVKGAVAVKLENGCGRMQNRMVVFQDGLRGCVRYRQNTDQIQGELFSFYLAQILKLPNLAPSAVSIVDLKSQLWTNLGNDIATAQWNSNKPVVVTQYIANLGSAGIPAVFKPVERHLNKFDVLNMTANEILDEEDSVKGFVELAQWSDLIIFDYLTANLDRIVNNLYNYQWNVNIMDAPAHNLAKKADTDLLVFLDNESGLLHGYRLLKKYEIYHSILLENLCVFRKSTVDVVKKLKQRGNVGEILREMFEERNSKTVKDLLPMLPDKSVKILNERIDKVYGQIVKCESMFSET
ncbi:DUF1193 domain containing protein [Asbolus verrucosus]|uniref:DUF1193 domain containing protein n=1 Tax=Asbolus verrucosus TaxID=1661398 RepID=A0A482VFW7_ASBVE|nr:DUF1193 domain containing protein [Asbolus verrucosus]